MGRKGLAVEPNPRAMVVLNHLGATPGQVVLTLATGGVNADPWHSAERRSSNAVWLERVGTSPVINCVNYNVQ